MEEILKMIESVDHTNKRAMFALNEGVYEWLLSINPETKYGNFVFSRDALKAIRPEGYFPQTNRAKKESYTPWGFQALAAKLTGDDLGHCTEFSPVLPTEELAELHAIIQAINHERKESDNERE